MMGATSIPETLVNIHQTARRFNPQDSHRPRTMMMLAEKVNSGCSKYCNIVDIIGS
jgi:hypothetical protein